MRAHRHGFVPEPVAQLPWRVILMVLAIGCFGLVVLYSAAGGSVRPWAWSQGIRFFVFLGASVALSRVPERIWKMGALPTYGVLALSLVAVELLGKISGGSQRWLDLGLIRLQPSELMKPAIILALARFYDILPIAETRRWSGIWPAAALIGVPAGLVMLQPDLGTALMIGAGGVTIMFLAGVPLRLFAAGVLGIAVAAPLALKFVLHDYQRNRILIFLDPESDPLGTGYHISQSKIAIGSGGLFGKGFLHGTQSQLDYLPERQTDFVFATMAGGMGAGRRRRADPLLLPRHPLGDAGRRASRGAVRAADGGGAGHDDLLLRRDQPRHGDGAGAGGRHPAAAGQLRRVGADDGAAVAGHPDVDRPPEPPHRPLVDARKGVCIGDWRC